MKSLFQFNVICVWILLLAMISLSCCPYIQAEERSDTIHVTAIGFGDSEEKALEKALISAVQNAVPSTIMADRVLHNNVLVKSTIRQQINGYIKGFDKTITQVNGQYKVTVNAAISQNSIKQDSEVMYAIQCALGNPKLMVVIHEQSNFKHDQSITAEAQIAGKLKTIGFELIDYTPLNENEINKLYQVDEASVRRIGQLNKHPFFIIAGDARLTEKPSLLGSGGISTYTGHLTIKIINPQTAEILNSFAVPPETIVSSDNLQASSQLLNHLSLTAVNDFIDKQLRDIWMNFFNNGIPIKILIKQINSFNLSNTICDCIKQISGVKFFEHNDWNNGFNALKVKFRGKSEELANQLRLECKLEITKVNHLLIEGKNRVQSD